jgi:hypothetical protein
MGNVPAQQESAVFSSFGKILGPSSASFIFVFAVSYFQFSSSGLFFPI